MTFLKFRHNLQNVRPDYWRISSIRFLVRLLTLLSAVYLINLMANNSNDLKAVYDFLSTSFYLLFFIFMEWYIKMNMLQKLNDEHWRWLKLLKWIPLIWTIVLMALSVCLNKFSWPDEAAARITYSYMKAWPVVVVPNLSFIIITVLIFYTQALLLHNRVLKQENELTI